MRTLWQWMALGVVAIVAAGCVTKAPLRKPEEGKDLVWPTGDVRAGEGNVPVGDGASELQGETASKDLDASLPDGVAPDVPATEVDGGVDVPDTADVQAPDGELPGIDGGSDADGGGGADADGGCTPDCQGKSCGDDGCGGSCGSCQDGCSCVQGSCACFPTCGDGECNGTETCDSCALDCGCDVPAEICEKGTCISCGTFCGNYGKSCGTFATCECGGCGCGQVCSSGKCQYNACDGKECGDDGCGGSCGSCKAGLKCYGGACKECDDGNAVDWDGCNSGKIVEFRVNKSTGGSQRRASVAVVGNGQFVIAWESDGSGCDQFDIVAQAFNAGGSTSGSEYKINGKTTLTQKLPWLTELQKEQFVAVWESELQGGADSFDIAARLMSFPGTPVAAEFKVNHHTADYQGNPRAAVFGDGGGFVVVWDSDNQDGSVAGVYARRYSATGTAQENMEFQANTYTTGWQGRPAAATCLDGSTQIFWESDGQDGGTYGVYGQGILGSGAFFQTEYKVNTTGAGDQSGPAAAGLDTCGVLVAWASVSPGEATSAIASQLLTAAGVKDGSEVLVSPYATAAAGGVAAVYQPKGGFVVAFHRCAKTAPDGTGCDVYFQRLDAAGKIVGPEVQVNLHTTSHQRWPAVAAFQNGSFVVVWESVEQDGNEEGVYAQRFTKDGTRIYH